MVVMAMFDDKSGSKVLDEVAAACGTDMPTVKQGLDALCPAIAAALQEKIKDDPEIADDLADLLEDNVTRSVASDDAVVDGKAMLAALFGTQKEARAQLAKAAPDLPDKVLGKLAPVAAVTVIAAVADQTRPMALTGVETAMSGTTSKIIASLVTAILSSAIRGVIRQITSPRTYRTSASKRRTSPKKSTTKRRSTTSRSKTRKTSASRSRTRKTTRKKTATSTPSRRNPSISIEDILGGLFGGKSS
jgi:hypothetical protein